MRRDEDQACGKDSAPIQNVLYRTITSHLRGYKNSGPMRHAQAIGRSNPRTLRYGCADQGFRGVGQTSRTTQDLRSRAHPKAQASSIQPPSTREAGRLEASGLEEDLRAGDVFAQRKARTMDAVSGTDCR